MKLKASVFLATPDELAAVQKARLNQADKTKLTRDHNGFRKLLVVITKAGKIYALHTGDGHVVWSLLVPSLRASYGGPHFAPLKILQWQVPHQHALDQNPVVLIISQAGELLVSNLIFLVYDSSILSFTFLLCPSFNSFFCYEVKLICLRLSVLD